MELDVVCAPELSWFMETDTVAGCVCIFFLFLERRWQCVDLNLEHSVRYPSSLQVDETARGLLERNFPLRLNKEQLWSKYTGSSVIG